MTDKELYKLCCKYGANARKWSKKFAGLLPKVYKRKLWKRYGFYSIEHFAAQLADMNHETTRRILNLNKKLADKPLLKAEIQNEGWTKVKVASSINAPEETLVKLVKTLPKSALEKYAKEVNSGPGTNPQPVKLTFSVKPETEFKLRKFRQKLEKDQKQSVSLGEALEILLNQLEEPQKKTRKSKGTTGRQISAQKKHEVENNGQCAFPGCNNPHKEYHHPDRYALTGNHSRIVPLCHEHHQIAHAGLITNENDSPKRWQIRETPRPNTIDLKYLKYAKPG